MQESSQTSAEIRMATPDEYDRIGEITVEAYRRAGQLGGAEAGYAEELADVAGRAVHADILVALVGGRIAGGATYVPGPGTPVSEFDDPHAAGIRMLAVDPELGRRGIGRALTEACVTRARVAGRRRVVLHTLSVNTAARQMYTTLGFARDPANDWEPVPDLHLVAYRLELEPADAIEGQQASTKASRS